MYVDKEKYKKQKVKKGVTANHLIDKTGVSRDMFYKYVNGKVEAPNDFMLRLSNELICPIAYLTKQPLI